MHLFVLNITRFYYLLMYKEFPELEFSLSNSVFSDCKMKVARSQILMSYIIIYNCLCLCRERKFTVSLKLASKPSLYHLQQFIQGRQLDLPQETLQLLDVVLREKPSKRYSSTIMLLNISIHICHLSKYMLLQWISVMQWLGGPSFHLSSEILESSVMG